MTEAATIARDNAAHCEAIKYAYRQTKEGVVVSFVIHPSDIPPALQVSPIGARYVLALVELDDQEQPKEVANDRKVTKEPAPDRDAPARAPIPFSEKPYDQQAGILGSKPRFRRFLAEHDKVPGILMYDEDTATQRVREICQVQSRTEIRPGTRAEQRWLLLVSAYEAWNLAPGVGAA